MANMNSDSEVSTNSQAPISKAKAQFEKALLAHRTEHGPPLSSQSVREFSKCIDEVFYEDTSKNVEKCTQWILKNIASSRKRTLLLGDFLIALSRSIDVDVTPQEQKRIRNRFNVLSIAFDAIHSAKYHMQSTNVFNDFVYDMQYYIEELVDLVASALRQKGTEYETRLKELVALWNDKFADEDDAKWLRERLHNTLDVAQGDLSPNKKLRTYHLPLQLRTERAPLWALPASYALDIVATQDGPSASSWIPLARFPKRRPSKKAKAVLDELFDKLDALDGPIRTDGPEGRGKRPGSLGAPVNAYGWSPEACAQMEKDHFLTVSKDDDDAANGSRRRPRSSSSVPEYGRATRWGDTRSSSPPVHESESRNRQSRYDRPRSRESYRGFHRQPQVPPPFPPLPTQNPNFNGQFNAGRIPPHMPGAQFPPIPGAPAFPQFPPHQNFTAPTGYPTIPNQFGNNPSSGYGTGYGNPNQGNESSSQRSYQDYNPSGHRGNQGYQFSGQRGNHGYQSSANRDNGDDRSSGYGRYQGHPSSGRGRYPGDQHRRGGHF
ncbi:uncharacterized protein EI97DRAFT_429764 [Westerdykella ornata]|uniref:Uncharacterized protein n=1 Tax=Westerdykella ornata TaxID=318751 RepID=A0A6A6JUE8_WESOR|nr:uncharacterized protein EI97DRAFT_429764 [Westerdykella ornata]KAF2280007.1 hypothetical protein EI97DRAFT_429764 [Westerdykella ornata]